MLKKDLAVAGAKVEINDKMNCGLPKMYMAEDDDGSIDHVTMQTEDGNVLLNPGDQLTVVEGPKRKHGTNIIIVEDTNGTLGAIFWCELRASATHL